MKTYYEILNVTPGAPMQAIHNRYRELARALHPDAGGDAAAFAEVAEAYATLEDEELRTAYDNKLALLMDPCPACDGTGTKFVQLSFTHTTPRRCAACNGRGWHERP